MRYVSNKLNAFYHTMIRVLSASVLRSRGIDRQARVIIDLGDGTLIDVGSELYVETWK